MKTTEARGLDRFMWRETVRVADSAEEIEAVYRLRYQVNVAEIGKPYVSADHDGGRLVDDLDAHSQNLVAVSGPAIIGAFRGTWGAARFSTEAPWHSILDGWRPEIPRERIALASRLVVDHDHRGRTRTATALMMALFHFACEAGMELCLCHTSDRYVRLCERVGWRRLGEPFHHAPSDTTQIPLWLSTKDLAHLHAVGSPFAAEVEARADQLGAP